jgi:hypothetical protein
MIVEKAQSTHSGFAVPAHHKQFAASKENPDFPNILLSTPLQKMRCSMESSGMRSNKDLGRNRAARRRDVQKHRMCLSAWGLTTCTALTTRKGG